MKSTLSTLLLALLATAATACPGFTVGQTSCSSGVLSSSSLSAQCSGDEDDASTIYVSGSVTASSDFDGDASVTLLPCARFTAGNVCFDNYKQDAGDVCSLLTTPDGGSCGSAGTYSVDLAFDVPEQAQQYVNSFTSSLFTIKVLIDDDETCQASADATTQGFIMVGVGSVIGASALFFMRRRKKPLLVLEDAGDEQIEFGTPRANFVEMKGFEVGCIA
ncbi:MAG: hypothetical protein SGILL_009383 [Bacillariaceae sp.]